MPEILIHKDLHCLRIVLNRPDRLNAVNEDLYQQTLDALRLADTDDDVRCVVMSGNGRAFCAGADLKAHQSGDRTAKERMAYVALGQDVCAQIQFMKTPVIAQVHGYALGGGAEIATSADFLLIAEDAMIGFPEVAIGTYVGGGVTHRLPKLVGLHKATELLLCGRRITGKEAAACGLASLSVTHDHLQEATDEIVRRLSANAPLPIAKIKRALAGSTACESVFRAEANDLLDIMRTEDWLEGVQAFSEKRNPTFSGK